MKKRDTGAAVVRAAMARWRAFLASHGGDIQKAIDACTMPKGRELAKACARHAAKSAARKKGAKRER